MTFQIRLNGKPYANYCTRLRKPSKVLAAYRGLMASLGYRLPSGDWSASPYMRNALDSFGS